MVSGWYGVDYPDVYDPGPEDNPTLSPLRYCHNGRYLQDLDLPALVWAVNNLLPEGLSLLAAPPKAGKSWLALDIALAVACAGKALGSLLTHGGEVLYVAMEDGERRLKDRVKVLLGDEPWPDGFHYCTKMPEGLTFLMFIEEWMEAHPGTRLIVVDTMGRVRPPKRDRDADSYREDYAFMASWQEFALGHHIALLVVHHTRKKASDYFVDEVSGTNGLTGAADVVMVLQRARNAQIEGVLQVTARDFKEHDLNLTRAGPCWQVFDGVIVSPSIGDEMARVITEVGRHEDGVGPKDVAAATGLDYDKVKTYLSRAVDRGDLTKAGWGIYVSVTSVTSVTFPGPEEEEGDTGNSGNTPPTGEVGP